MTWQGTTGTDDDGRSLVVMVDDDPNDHLLMAMAARHVHLPLRFEHVSDGGNLLLELNHRRSQAELPSVILLDLRMPGLDGFTTLRLLKLDPDFRTIPVWVFSSSVRERDRRASLEEGAHWMDVKPSGFASMVSFASTLAKRIEELDGEVE